MGARVSNRVPRALPVGLAWLCLVSVGVAQTGVERARFRSNPGRLDPAPTAVSSASLEVDFEAGDLDRDGWAGTVLLSHAFALFAPDGEALFTSYPVVLELVP